MFKLIKRKVKQRFCDHLYVSSGDHWDVEFTCEKCGKTKKIDW